MYVDHCYGLGEYDYLLYNMKEEIQSYKREMELWKLAEVLEFLLMCMGTGELKNVITYQTRASIHASNCEEQAGIFASINSSSL